jgi:DNA-binding beta-propeller fold protein YncE
VEGNGQGLRHYLEHPQRRVSYLAGAHRAWPTGRTTRSGWSARPTAPSTARAPTSRSPIGMSCRYEPCAVAVDNSDNVYVVDSANNRIQKFNSTGGFIRAWGSFGTENGQFDQPVRIAVDVSGFIYVVDDDNVRVQKFSQDGVFITKWTVGGGPLGISVCPDGSVYVGINGEISGIYKYRRVG